ncbi:hypothetical protein [Pelomonas cellulosilytica]|uniref:Fibronectin type-III domain-containing protein n=1 Tax=Pelomonas cellulosilytica TaxID=2906762 RepID=A0ABS8XZY5_9BURK|nr:hypothetical protein [Pelomonas sp. P8]MCE4558159.1 hypothetical protein [Pelomonas sp. P8]
MVLIPLMRTTGAALSCALVLAACGGGAAGDDGPRVHDDAQSIRLGDVPTLQVGGTATLAATASSGLPVGLGSLTPAICTLDAVTGQIRGLSIGDCTIAANQGGNDRFAPAPQATLVVPVTGRAQSLSFDPLPPLIVGDAVTASASASSGLTVRFTSQTPDLCSVDPDRGSIAALAAGTCTVAAEQPGNGQWSAAAMVMQATAVSGQPQRISLAALPPLLVGAGTSAQASASSGLAPHWSSLTPEVCSISTAGALLALTAGTCTVAADQPGDTRWAAAVQAQTSTSVSRATQTVTLNATPASLTVGSPATARATASSGLPVTLSSLTPAICGVDAASGSIASLGAGQCVLQASQAGDATWLAASPASLSLPVVGMPQSISLTAAPALTVNAMAVARATSSSGLSVTFTSTSPQTCSTTPAGTVTGLRIGNCTLALNQAGNSSWAAAPQASLTVAVAGQAQTISFAAAPALAMGGAATVRATASSGLAVAYNSLTPAACTVDAASGLVTSLAVGACTIAASQPGNTLWAAAPQVVQTLSSTVAPQSLVFAPAADIVVNGQTTVRAMASSGLPAVYASLSSAICSVGGTTGLVTGLMTGTCTVAASQPGDSSWAPAAQVIASLNVSGQPQSLTFSAPPSLTAGSSATVRATASSGLPVVYSSVTPSVCSVVAATGVVSASIPGSCRIAADQPGNAIWAAATPSTLSLTVSTAPQSISFGAAPAVRVGTSGTVRAVATSGLPVSYGSQSSTCSVGAATGVVTGLAAGSCVVTATQPGNGVWGPATPVTQSLSIAPDPNQTISFGTAPLLTLGGSATVAATASSGLPVSLASLSPTVCGVAAGSGLVTATTLGDCLIAANQAGNGSYNPAPQATLTLPVQLPPGMSAPGVPSGVTASLGTGINQVLVTATSVNSGGSAITHYTVTSSPAGLSAQASALPVAVTCPGSCAGYTFSLTASNAVGNGSSSAAVEVLTTFDVVTRFYEPDTQPRDSIFTGSFMLNSTTGAITGLTGRLTESMSGNAIGSAPFFDMTQVPLTYQLQTWRDAALGGSFVASFAKNTTSTFSTAAGGDGWSPQAGVAVGGVYAGFPSRYATSIQNSSILIFVPDNPFTPLTPAQIARLAYADCAPGGMMGAVCMTATSIAGYGTVGTMSGYPVSQQISRH